MNQLEKLVEGGGIFAQKNFYQTKRMSLQLETWEGAVSLPMRSGGRSSGETWKLISLQEVIFPESWV